MHPNLRNRLPGILFTVVLVLAEILFMALLIHTKLIPTKFLILAGVLMLLLAALVYFLVRDLRHGGRLITGAVLAGLVIVLFAFGGSYISQGVSALGQITETTVEIAEVGIYVPTDDPASGISDAAGYTFGILSALDRENTDKTIAQISENLGRTIVTKEYPGLGELVDSVLVSGETNAIIMNSAYLELLTEMEGYETAPSQLRELHTEQVETIIERVVNPKTDSKGNADLGEGDFASDSEHVFSMYISGIDSRSGLISKSRSDVNIVATINTETRQVLLVATPRDYYVPLSISDGVPDKLTHAGIYGIDVSMETLEMLYDTTIDYYFRVNFSGFENIINALGGITVESEYEFSTGNYHYYEGANELDGAAALAFARERYAFASGDRQRGKNQMAVIKAIINKAISPALLMNYSSILESVSGSFETSMPYDVIAGLVRDQLNSGGSWNIVSYSVDGTGDSQKPYSLSTNAYVMIPNYDTVNHAIELMNQVKNGETLNQE